MNLVYNESGTVNQWGKLYGDTLVRTSGKKIKVELTSQTTHQDELEMDKIFTCEN